MVICVVMLLVKTGRETKIRELNVALVVQENIIGLDITAALLVWKTEEVNDIEF